MDDDQRRTEIVLKKAAVVAKNINELKNKCRNLMNYDSL